MVQFNELRIRPNGEELIIDVSVINSPYYENVYISSLQIDTHDNYVGNGMPSTNPIYRKDFTNQPKNIREVLTSLNLTVSLRTNLFFVYIITGGDPSPDVPCGMDNQTTVRSVANLYPFYQNTINLLAELGQGCNIPVNLANAILQIKGLELAIRTGNYIVAIDYWKKFFMNIRMLETSVDNCGCYGRNY